MTSPKSIIVVGAGGHGKVAAATLLRAGQSVSGFIDANPALRGQSLLGLPILGDDEFLTRDGVDNWLLVNGIGGAGGSTLRKDIFLRLKFLGYSFASIIDPSAVISHDVQLGEGVHIFAGAVVQPSCTIGENSIVNTKASIDHDGVLGPHVHVAPGATVSGSVSIGAETHIGTGASVRQGLRIGEGVVIGVGAAVVCDIAAGATVVGVPAKPLISRS
ncbi:Carbonic anhydrase [Rhodospirillaceae bacterium LM-1]|nr:Carbonic anhydrase [Rhodospirillaceae bacterium LM-1]